MSAIDCRKIIFKTIRAIIIAIFVVSIFYCWFIKEQPKTAEERLEQGIERGNPTSCPSCF